MSDLVITQQNVDDCLKELGKEYRRLVGKNIRAEIILVGGASVLLNYRFRSSTYDMDAILHASSALKDAINHVGDRLGLPNGWLNDDFVRTASYSAKLSEVSRYYRTFSNVLEVRTIDAEYLVAMKLVSARQYKNDLSDIIGILAEHQKRGTPLALEKIQNAVCQLYGDWDIVSSETQIFLEQALAHEDLAELYHSCRQAELESKTILQTFESRYPGVLEEASVEEVLRRARKKKAADGNSSV